MRQVFQGAGEFSCSCWILMLGICCSINFVDLKTYRQQLTVLNNANAKIHAELYKKSSAGTNEIFFLHSLGNFRI
jgi:hypothetical protein